MKPFFPEWFSRAITEGKRRSVKDSSSIWLMLTRIKSIECKACEIMSINRIYYKAIAGGERGCKSRKETIL